MGKSNDILDKLTSDAKDQMFRAIVRALGGAG